MRSWLPLLCALALGACTPDVAQDEPPFRVVAEFDPAAEIPRVPAPNALAYDDETARLAPPDHPGLTEAERQLNDYLRQLDGFPAGGSATQTFSAPLEPASVTTDAVRVLDVTDPENVRALPTPVQLTRCASQCAYAPDPAGCTTSCRAELQVTVRYEPDARRVRIEAPFEASRTYAVALLAGEGGLRGEGGAPVVGAPAFVMLRSQRPLTTCEDLSAADCRPATSLIRGETEDEARASAVRLERARRQLAPALAFLEEQGIPRQTLASAWTFHTARMPLATFDPGRRFVPFPTDLLLENGRVALPDELTDDASAQTLKASLNTLDGFSMTASIYVEVSDAVGAATLRLARSSLAASQFVLARLDNPSEQVPVQLTCHACGDFNANPGAQPDQLSLKPTRPLRPKTTYVLLWLTGARGRDGLRVQPSGALALLRLSTPLWANGKSALAGLDDESAEALETLRQKYAPTFALADGLGIARADILWATFFTTQSGPLELPALRALPQTWNLTTQVTGGPGNLTLLNTSSLASYLPDVRWVKEGSYTAGNALDPSGTEEDLSSGLSIPTEGAFTAATLASPTLEQRQFFLAVPKVAKTPATGKIPVLIFQHGLGGSRRNAFAIANTAAQFGYATLAIDAPFHGNRTFCQANVECRVGTVCTNHRCPDDPNDPNDGYALTPLGTFTDLIGVPLRSGEQFVSTTNLLASRDHFRQQVIDLAQLVRVLGDTTAGIGAIDVDDAATGAVVETLDPQNPRYIGQSMGGIMGALITAALPEILSATLNVPGASQADIVANASHWNARKAQVDAYLTARGRGPGTQAYERFIDHGRWAMDAADPQNVGRHLIAEPLPDALTQAPLPRKRVFISWIQGDQVVPNATTQLFINSIDAAPAPANFKQKMYVGGDHAFLVDVISLNAPLAYQAQAEAMQWVDP